MCDLDGLDLFLGVPSRVSRASIFRKKERTLGASMMTFGWRLVYDILSQREVEQVK